MAYCILGGLSQLNDKRRATPISKEVASSLIGSDELVRLLLDSTGDGIYGIDLNGICTFANPACAKLLGFESTDELLGRNMHELIHHTRANGEPYPVEECQIYQGCSTGKGTHVDDEVMFCADGNSFPCEYWSYPILRNDEVIGCVVTFVDVTERRRNEELQAAHAETLERVARFPEMNPGPVLRVKGDGTVRLANSAAREVFGDELVGRNWLDIFPRLGDGDWKDILKANEPISIETRFGEQYFIFTHRRDLEGDLVFVFGTDITLQKKAEADLRVYSQIVSTSTDFVSLIDRDYVYQAVNQSYLDALGKKREDIVGHTVAEVLGADFFESNVKAHLDRALDGEPADFQSPLDIAAAGPRILNVRCDPFRDTKGQVTGVLVDARDVTEEKNAEQALREADDLVRLLLNSTGEGIYGIDLEGNCTFANPACAKLLGFKSVDDVLGQQMHMLIHHTRANGEPYPVEECRIYQAFHKGEGTHVDDEVMFCADGKPFPCEYWSYPMIRDNELLGCVVTFVDITERRRVEDELRQTEKMAALGKLSAGLAHELNNPAAAASRAANQLREGIDGLQSVTIDLARSGLESEIWNLLTDCLNEMRERATTLADLTPLEASDREEELLEWLEQHGVDNSWMIAPVFVSVGIEVKDLDTLAEKLAASPLPQAMTWLCRAITAADLAKVVERSSRSISDLVNIVKSYSHMDKAPSLCVDIHDGIEDTLAIMHHKLKRGVEIIRDYNRDLPQVVAQGSELNQVWTNLLDNAISAMDGKGTIRIETYLDDGLVTVAIADDGPGIPKEIQHRIYEPFFTTKDVGDGTGLGLDVVNRIVTNRCGGRIDLESMPGSTTFRVHIPIDADCAITD
jgi:PAS domain S-box-containing protein